MKKILHISKFYHPYYGGIEDVVYTIVSELRNDYEQRVICFNHERGTIRTLDNGIEILRISTPLSISSQPISFSYYRHLRREIKRFKPDYVHLHLPNPLICIYLLLCNLYGAKLVVHWHADILGKKFLYNFCRPIEQLILKRAEVIISTSTQYVNGSIPLKKYQSKVIVLPNTINENKFYLYDGEEAEVEKIRERYKGKKIVFFIGRHVEYKGVDYLIRAINDIDKEAIVLIAGTGQETQHLKRLSESCSDRVVFLGRLPNEIMKYYFYASDVFVFPSIDRREAFGVALAEALYCKLPAVSFKINDSGTTWVNQNGVTGEVVEKIDEKELAMAINKILRDEDLRKRYSKNAHEWVCKNFLPNQIQKLKHVYV